MGPWLVVFKKKVSFHLWLSIKKTKNHFWPLTMVLKSQRTSWKKIINHWFFANFFLVFHENHQLFEIPKTLVLKVLQFWKKFKIKRLSNCWFLKILRKLEPKVNNNIKESHINGKCFECFTRRKAIAPNYPNFFG
jgi:hypothetical protein